MNLFTGSKQRVFADAGPYQRDMMRAAAIRGLCLNVKNPRRSRGFLFCGPVPGAAAL